LTTADTSLMLTASLYPRCWLLSKTVLSL